MIDLSSTAILPARPLPEPTTRSADPAVQAAARALAPVLARSLQGTEAEVLVLDGSGLIAAPGAGRALVDHIICGADYAAADNVCQAAEPFFAALGFERDGKNMYGQPVWTWYAE